MKDWHASYRLVIFFGYDQSVTIACVVPSSTKRLLGVLRQLKSAAVILYRRLVLVTICCSPEQASLLLVCSRSDVYQSHDTEEWVSHEHESRIPGFGD